MIAPRPLTASVLICTYNRCTLLRRTLASLRGVVTIREWAVIVVDNNSSDETRAVVEEAARTFPVPLQYIFEPRQGKSYALNTGIERAAGEVIVFTDDDVEVEPHWVEGACRALDLDDSLDYTGGPVRPIWGAPPPAWLDQTRGDLWGTLAILDYGTDQFVFEERKRVPVGANMAVRRRLVERVGGFHPELGRRGKSLLGQEQAEFFARSRAAGARGVYVPSMELRHHVPASRLTKDYFRRWWYWKGLSRARVEAMHQRTELGLDLSTVPHIAGVPRFVLGQLPRAAFRWLAAVLRRRWQEAARQEMQCAYTWGYIRGCRNPERIATHAPAIAPAHTAAAPQVP